MQPSARGKTTGVYGAERIPGNYVKTLTGAVRGEELFCRPDLERPWRSADKQRSAATIALKEKEIEELMRLCSSLRTELSNTKSDSLFLEYSLTERTKLQLAEKQNEVDALQRRVEKLEKEKKEAAAATESQIRLLRSQAENESIGFKNEARVSTERCAELMKAFQKQLEDVKAAGVREVEFVEARFAAKVNEVTTELKAVRESKKALEEHYRAVEAQSANMVHRVEADYKERLRSLEQRIEEQRIEYEAQLAKERKEKEAAVGESKRTTEKLAVLIADKEELLQKQKLWNSYILSHLDTFYHSFIAVAPEMAVNPTGVQFQQVPALYAPRCVLEDPESKVNVERIAYRVAQLKLLKALPPLGEAAVRRGAKPPSAAQLDQVVESQERLWRALRELEDQKSELEATVNSFTSRLYFFSDNLEESLRRGPRPVPPPLRDVVFLCLCVPNGRVLWAADTELMRTSVQMLYGTLRLKMGEYGAYECYSDDVSMLLAFADATAACRFCTESQEWLMRLPWPAALLKLPEAQEERSDGGRLLYRGLRVSMALHAGEAYVEPSGIPLNWVYRNHYYGKAVSQLVHLCSVTQGGQIIASIAAWNLCVRRRHELGAVVAKSLGTLPIVSFNSQSGVQEKQNIELLQILPIELEGRTFTTPSKAVIPPVSSLTGVKESVLAAEVAAVEAQRERVHDALAILQEECNSIQSSMGTLVARTRAALPHFHLLPPSEMVTQMNDLYSVMERVAVRAEELYTDLQDVAHAQEELGAQAQSIKDYFQQQEASAAREDDLRTKTEAIRRNMNHTLQLEKDRHRAETESLQLALQDREQLIRKLHQESQSRLTVAAVES
ncbi:conserved hypothetical protein [Leishmania mexicana MHOM/GT/2001/U1103]|uniref:adenylate cyclase n=1 Tax=Leishmania mexicana (strain MHOM/GT/2001/U1103) TaxID=929439 RepID=E9AKA9_LEIMU|nr:conserved hypothetical protein [Leishmania mexicana MHOM/GT/2001/U1103]CBZ23360.1 conserved hypothetical protein [Leishmania mexicana MHOM/GT/2001/U1103]